jgi:hypothetical protein
VLREVIASRSQRYRELITAGAHVILELVANNPRRWALLFRTGCIGDARPKDPTTNGEALRRAR